MMRKFSQKLVLMCLCSASLPVFAVEVSNRYRSPRNPERNIRRSTELIVLHTTEAPARSSLNKLSDRGEAHYCVTEEGSVYRIVDRDREAFHAGRSMWKGREDVDKYSIGIECVGYHNKPMSSVQIYAIRELVAELKKMYNLSDDRVVCHSHVAYGAPNKWQKRRHRGRKRCGMLFAMPSMRRALGLKARPAFDADTRSGRLSIGDEYLNKVLYGRVDTMAGRIGTSKIPPSGPKSSGGWFARLIGPKKAPEKKPSAVVPSAPPSKAQRVKSVVSKPANGPARPAKAVLKSAQPRTIAELKDRGYEIKGTITRHRTAMKIAGRAWNSNDTYYIVKGKIVPGNEVNASKLSAGVSIWMKR
jgi:hypothetical protein